MLVSCCKTILINLIVLCAFALLLELSYRTWSYFRNCDTGCHNIAFINKLDAFSHGTPYGFMAADPQFGYSPVDGTFAIHERGWNGATVTIRNGVRVNPNFEPSAISNPILAVGDSFVFGDQVSDDQTWPAVLERKLNRRVVNGGVSGFGPVQAVLRAEQLVKVQTYSLIIFSILVLEGPRRDQWVNMGGTYRPAVIREAGRLRLTSLEESGKVLSERFVCAHPWIPEFFFWSHVAERFFARLGYDGSCTSIIHPKAAEVNDIIEFVVERLAALPVDKVILLQYPNYAFADLSLPARLGDRAIDQVHKIRDGASRHQIPVIDTYDGLRHTSFGEMYVHSSAPHHSKRGNEVVADVIARDIALAR
jgi:hypothetical protein